MNNNIVKTVDYGITISIPYSKEIHGWAICNVSRDKIADVEAEFVWRRDSEKSEELKIQHNRARAYIRLAMDLGGIPTCLQHIEDQLHLSFVFSNSDDLSRFDNCKDSCVEASILY